MKYDCPRCSGLGRIKCYSHVIGGKCFRCAGSGKVSTKPVVSTNWAVLGTDQTGNRAHAYNVRARTAGAAIKRARQMWCNASIEWKTSVSLEDALAVPYDEYWANA